MTFRTPPAGKDAIKKDRSVDSLIRRQAMLRLEREKKQQVLTQAGSSRNDLQEKIARRAYQLYEEGGCVNGNDMANWLKAERAILKQRPSA